MDFTVETNYPLIRRQHTSRSPFRMGRFSQLKLNREYDDETKALVTRAIYKLLYNEVMKDYAKNFVKEKLEEQGYSYENGRLGRPKKHSTYKSEEGKEKDR